ncbi:MAG: hypothetical protein IJU91_02340 [Selenomonadaceae bacterium]|nr:hypothetical protein [Selenomonadaceae bacterium]
MNDDEPRKDYWQLKDENAELQKAVNAKTGKLLTRYFAPQPLENFHPSDALNQMFRQLCKIYDAENIAFNPKSLFEGSDKLPLIKALGELIIIATSYLEKIGVNDSARQKLFKKLNEENARND